MSLCLQAGRERQAGAVQQLPYPSLPLVPARSADPFWAVQAMQPSTLTLAFLFSWGSKQAKHADPSGMHARHLQ